MNRVPLLVATKGVLIGNRYQIVEGEGISIGRAEQCDVTIPDSDVSRQHAKVVLHNAGIWVQDSNSRNGIFINGKRVVRPKELREGGELSIGEHVFILELAEVEDDDPSVIRPIRSGELTEKDNTIWIIMSVILLLIILIAFVL